MITLNIPNISCDHCARAVTLAVKAIDPTARITVDVPQRRAAIESQAPLAAICDKLAQEGYPATAAA